MLHRLLLVDNWQPYNGPLYLQIIKYYIIKYYIIKYYLNILMNI